MGFFALIFHLEAENTVDVHTILMYPYTKNHPSLKLKGEYHVYKSDNKEALPKLWARHYYIQSGCTYLCPNASASQSLYRCSSGCWVDCH